MRVNYRIVAYDKIGDKYHALLRWTNWYGAKRERWAVQFSTKVWRWQDSGLYVTHNDMALSAQLELALERDALLEPDAL